MNPRTAAALAMLSAWLALPVQAQTCPEPPSFGLGGKTCTAANQTRPCYCDEPMTWTPVPGAEWYEVWRIESSGLRVRVGDTRWKDTCATWKDDGLCATAAPPITRWLPEWDCADNTARCGLVPFGSVVRYAVRACMKVSNRDVCSAHDSRTTKYAGASVTCYSGKLKVPCS